MTLAAVTAARRHALVQIEGLDVVWHTMTGGGLSVEIVEDPSDPGGEGIPGLVSADNIVLTTGFSPHNDLDWVREMKRGIGVDHYTVIRQWTDENWAAIGTPEVYPGCLLIGYTNPVTGPTSEPAEFTVTLSTTGEAF